jgi:hypothetical protein
MCICALHHGATGTRSVSVMQPLLSHMPTCSLVYTDAKSRAVNQSQDLSSRIIFDDRHGQTRVRQIVEWFSSTQRRSCAYILHLRMRRCEVSYTATNMHDVTCFTDAYILSSCDAAIVLCVARDSDARPKLKKTYKRKLVPHMHDAFSEPCLAWVWSSLAPK